MWGLHGAHACSFKGVVDPALKASSWLVSMHWNLCQTHSLRFFVFIAFLFHDFHVYVINWTSLGRLLKVYDYVFVFLLVFNRWMMFGFAFGIVRYRATEETKKNRGDGRWECACMGSTLITCPKKFNYHFWYGNYQCDFFVHWCLNSPPLPELMNHFQPSFIYQYFPWLPHCSNYILLPNDFPSVKKIRDYSMVYPSLVWRSTMTTPILRMCSGPCHWHYGKTTKTAEGAGPDLEDSTHVFCVGNWWSLGEALMVCSWLLKVNSCVRVSWSLVNG